MAEQDVEDVRNRLETGSARDVREAVRAGEWRTTTHGLARGFVQANVAIVPEAYALDFMHFCHRNHAQDRSHMLLTDLRLKELPQ